MSPRIYRHGSRGIDQPPAVLRNEAEWQQYLARLLERHPTLAGEPTEYPCIVISSDNDGYLMHRFLYRQVMEEFEQALKSSAPEPQAPSPARPAPFRR